MIIFGRSKKLLNQVRLSNYRALRLRNVGHMKASYEVSSNSWMGPIYIGVYWREFVDVELTVDRLMYVYQYMDSSDKMVFRYDNTGHHRKLNVPTYPHHKHEGCDDNVVPSATLDLANVLKEIELLVNFE